MLKRCIDEDGSIKCCEKCGISKDHSKIFENYPCKHPICIDCLSFKPTNEENYSCPVAGCQNKINIIELNKFWYDVIKEGNPTMDELLLIVYKFDHYLEYGEYDPFTFLTVAKISKEEKKEKEKEKPKPQPRIKGLA